MSHHLDSPLARQDVRLDITDIYVFRGETGTVLIMDLNNSILGEDRPRGFHPEARYEFRIDLDGDAVEDLVYRVTFGPRMTTGIQPFELRRLTGPDATDPAATGTVLASGTTEHTVDGAGGLRAWAGAAADPFAIEPTVLKAIGAAFNTGTRIDLGDWLPSKAINLFAGTNVESIVLEIPDAAFDSLVGSDRQIGVWGTTYLATDAGGWRPINRAGRPMIQPIFNPDDSERSSTYNTTHPADDKANYGARFAGQIAAVVAAQGTSDDPAAYGATVANLLLPDILPYRIGTVASYSFGMRNGRTLTDSAPDVMFSLATNSALATGLTRALATAAPRASFPYLAPPVSARKPVPA